MSEQSVHTLMLSKKAPSHATFHMDVKPSEISLDERESDALTFRQPSFCFMSNRQKYRILLDGEDMTPDDIVDPMYVTMIDTFSHAAYETKGRGKADKSFKMRVRSSMLGMRVFATTIDLDDIHIDHTINTEEGYPPDNLDVDRPPSAFCLPKIFPPMSYPKQVFITLKETETQYLFELPSTSVDKTTSLGPKVEADNEYYQYITVGKGRNRKMVNQETQTREPITQARHSLATRPQKKNAGAFASLWDMHDTYQLLAQKVEEESDDEMVIYQSADVNLLRKKRVKDKAQSTKYKKKVTVDEIVATPQFQDAVLLTMRVLSSKEYSGQQKIFRGLTSVDPLSPDLIYVYSMKPLWTFECAETMNHAITSICFNPVNSNILAVGHGKFGYADNVHGFVCIWCTKNPSAPERLYRFQYPVTSVSFSLKRPNWLAVAFTNGDMLLIDIVSYTIKIIAQSKRATNPTFEPVWVTNWRENSDEGEYVLTAGQDGRINRFTSTKTHDFICTPMMRLSTVEGKMKGLEAAKPCVTVDVPITRYPAALCVNWHPYIEHVYLVGTDEGCIHRCSTHYLNQHIDVFRAHMGPVYAMEYSPFWRTLFITGGADNAIRMWMENVDEVLLTMMCSAAVYGIAFCPKNATIVLSVSGNMLSVWDLRRKTHSPCIEYSFAANVVLTYVKFSECGDNVFVGDTTGRIHTFHLEDTPIPPYFQYKMLEETVKRALCTRPHLLKQLEKMAQFKEKCAR